MGNPGIPAADARRFFAEIEKALAEGHYPPSHPDVNGRDRRSAVRVAGLRLKMRSGAIFTRYRAACRTLGHEPDWSKWNEPAKTAPYKPTWVAPVIRDPDELLRKRLQRPATIEELVVLLGMPEPEVRAFIEDAIARGTNIQEYGGGFVIEKQPTPGFARGEPLIYTSRKDNTFVFGLTSDNHLGSKYERNDCLEDIYDRFVEAKVDRAFNCGNWIEGEARFNRTDISVHGMDAQLAYLAKHYPRRKGIDTYAVAGDDHEGWYGQREGVEIGRYAEMKMREAGRTDWHDMGFMEAHVRLVNANTGKEAIAAFVHPGGGSAYADSYVVQKIIESLEGGEKPAFAAYGHYHKMLSGECRGVWWVLVPSTKDQDIFMRKKRLRSVVGGGIITLEQDPRTGAITGMTPKLWRYFNRDYYNHRWSHAGPVVLPKRSI